METRILIVDDDPFICRQLEELYTSQRYAVACAPNSTEALRLLGEQEFSLAVVDLKIPGTDGIGLTREIRDRWPDLDVIMITGYASIKGAVEAIKQGASDYITKPFQKEEILLATEKILEKRRLLDEINYLRSQLSDRYSFANMVSRNRVMHEIFETISVLAQNDATVLIYGESGTGKELAARAIHFQGKRKSGRFVAINCAAFPDTLLESELFGYERGAFTGAIHDRVGKIELSSGGTLFLDEIESISLNMQLKLLRVLEEREVEKLGSNRRIKVNMRIICATNMDLAAAVAEGRMREDFYYRINVVPAAHPAAARAHRGHPAAGGRVPPQQRDGAREGHQPPLEQGALPADELRLAGQRARARQRHRARHPPDQRIRDPRGRPAGALERRPGDQQRQRSAGGLRLRGAAEGVPPARGEGLSDARAAEVPGRHQPVGQACPGRCRDAASQDEAPRAPAGGVSLPGQARRHRGRREQLTRRLLATAIGSRLSSSREGDCTDATSRARYRGHSTGY